MALIDPLNKAREFLGDPLAFVRNNQDNGQRVPVTATRTSYGMTLHAKVGNKRGVIGAAHELAVNQNMTIDEEFEVDALATGLPRELVPQIVTGRTLNLQRYELWTQTMSQVFGTPELITLADQRGAFSVRVSWKQPGGSQVGSIFDPSLAPEQRVYEFMQCYISSWGQTMSMNNTINGANATIVWRTCRRLL